MFLSFQIAVGCLLKRVHSSTPEVCEDQTQIQQSEIHHVSKREMFLLILAAANHRFALVPFSDR